MRIRRLASVICVTAFVVGVLAPRPRQLVAKETPDATTVAAKIDALLTAAYPADEPGAAVLVTKDGEVLHRRAYGMANVELGVALAPDMVFRLGSITKQLTGAAFMLLEERGELSVDDPITKYLPDYPVHGHEITIEHLLTHTSGIRSYTAIPGYMANPVRADLTMDELVDVFQGLPMDFAPGTQWRYNNSGYVLAGAIIERVSGKSYADFIQENIFTPLKMTGSHYGGHQIIPKRVAGYQRDAAGYQNAAYVSMTQPHAAGSLLSTVDDMGRWDRALTSNALLTPASYEKMTTPYVLSDGTATGYGYGFMVGDLRGRLAVQHGGGIHGFSTYAIRLPQERIYVVILSNATGAQPGPSALATQIAAIALGDPFPVFEEAPVDAEILKRTVGVYKISATEERIVTFEDGKLYTQRSGGGRLEAIPASPTRFFYRNRTTYFDVERDDDGNATCMVMYPNGSKEGQRAERISAEPPPPPKPSEIDPALYDDYVGVYELTPGFQLTVTRKASRLFVQATGQQQLEVFPRSETEFFLKVVDAQLTFVRGEDGKVGQVILHQNGRDMPAKRVK